MLSARSTTTPGLAGQLHWSPISLSEGEFPCYDVRWNSSERRNWFPAVIRVKREEVWRMSVSFYVAARRPIPLTAEERLAIDRIAAKYAVDNRIKRFEATGEGFRWHPFRWFAPEEFSYADAILEGTAEIPTESEEALTMAILHWCNAASALRREIHKALWEVRVEDHEIGWDYVHERYDALK